jgi:hypothetical protein
MPIELKPLPPKEAVEFFRQKGFKVGFDYRDVWQSEHQAAFTVAKAMNLDILKDIRSAVDDALANGTSFEDFRKNLKPALAQKGWWGKAAMEDPHTGEASLVQLGSNRRLRTIYDTNLRTSHSEGQWQRIQQTKDTFPYLMYSGGHSAHPRHLHLSWSGLVLRADDPFWEAHYPVKAWGCKCRVIQQTEGMLSRKGVKPQSAPSVGSFTYTNKRTGEIQQIPDGVDPAFNYPPAGRRAALNNYLAEKVDNVDQALATSAVKDLVGSDAFKSFYAKPVGVFPIAVIGAEDAKLLGTGTQTVRLSAATMQKQVEQHPEIQADEYTNVQDAITSGQRIQDTDGSIVYLWEAGSYVTVVKATKSGKALFMTSLRRLSSNEVKRDEEIKRLLRKTKG